MDLIFFGMQGAGKGTLGKIVAKKYGMTIAFAGTEKEDDNSMTVLVHFESPEGLKGFGGDQELTQARIDCGVIMDQSKMTIMTDESVTNHKG